MYVKNAGFMKEIRAQKFIHISDKNRYLNCKEIQDERKLII